MLWSVLVSAVFAWLARADDNDDPHDFFHFVTRPDISAPKWDIKVFDADALQQEGHYWFIAPYQNLTQTDRPRWNGPHIYDTTGELIWSGAPLAEYFNTFDFKMSEINGEQMLSYIWQKDGGNNGHILDSSYQSYASLNIMGDFEEADIHEFNLIGDGDRALVVRPPNYTTTQIDVPKYSGACKFGHQGFQVIDVHTGNVELDWRSNGHIDPEERGVLPDVHSSWEGRCSRGWDAIHMNAVDKFDDGDYLISARDTNTVYKVSHVDGSIVWRLGGTWSDFKFIDERARFTHQHHARFHHQNETHILISVLNNALGVSGSGLLYSSSESWGLLIMLRTDVQPMTAELVVRFAKPLISDAGYYTKYRGSVSLLPNGNAFVGWSDRSHISEHAPNGRPLMTAILRTSINAASYRSYKMPWTGHPAQPPDVAASAERNGQDLTTLVYISWNGATEVDTWNVLRTNEIGNISTLVASSPRHGFETKITFDGVASHVIAVAMDLEGQEIGRSLVASVDIPADLRTPAIAQSEQEWVTSHSSSWWETPVKADASAGFTLPLFIVGFVCSIILSYVGIWWWLRRRKTIAHDEGEADQQTPMLKEKPGNDEEDEEDEEHEND